jgi:hypothetical protein
MLRVQDGRGDGIKEAGSKMNVGWVDPVGTLEKMRTAVAILAEDEGKLADRLERATPASRILRLSID